jgi:hypothetical protein
MIKSFKQMSNVVSIIKMCKFRPINIYQSQYHILRNQEEKVKAVNLCHDFIGSPKPMKVFQKKTSVLSTDVKSEKNLERARNIELGIGTSLRNYRGMSIEEEHIKSSSKLNGRFSLN